MDCNFVFLRPPLTPNSTISTEVETMERQHKLKNLSDRNSVLKAIEEWNEIGETEFFRKYSRGVATIYQLVYEGRYYPPKAIAGAAYYHQFGVQLERFYGGPETNDKLKELGFEVVRKKSEEQSESRLSGNEFIDPKNQILYGPPGTGKTWYTVNLSLAIIHGVNVDDIDDEDRMDFNDYVFNISDDSSEGQGQIAFTTFHQNYAYEDFVEGIRPTMKGSKVGYEIRDGIFKKLAKSAEDNPSKCYVLIIDEINRGNIAKIFGELITLIEDSKRLRGSDAKEVILPYSQQSFGVPPNLFIIGTMNTADRSIQILDTALRRRFNFVEMMPKPSHKNISIDVDGINCQKILESMNQRIIGLLDRERQIGHTYFFDLTTIERLADVFQNRIIPLLQEYFFDDWSKIRAILGKNAFVREDVISHQSPVEYRDSEIKYYERLPANDEKWKDPRQYKKIYNLSEATKPDT